jgi:hypothetical protein
VDIGKLQKIRKVFVSHPDYPAVNRFVSEDDALRGASWMDDLDEAA